MDYMGNAHRIVFRRKHVFKIVSSEDLLSSVRVVIIRPLDVWEIFDFKIVITRIFQNAFVHADTAIFLGIKVVPIKCMTVVSQPHSAFPVNEICDVLVVRNGTDSPVLVAAGVVVCVTSVAERAVFVSLAV